MEWSHHIAASLYFGIAALEGFVNSKLRKKREEDNVPEREILKELRFGKITDKLTKCPIEVLGKDLTLSKEALSIISTYNAIRGEITHVKVHGQLLYQQLDNIDPSMLIDLVAEYLVRFHELESRPYPYWIFGWNYLNPRTNSYEIILQNNDQFCFSLRGLGINFPLPPYADKEFLRFERYLAIKRALASVANCEPKSIFPFKPILCKEWWTREHQVKCGHVTDEAIDNAHRFGRGQR